MKKWLPTITAAVVAAVAAAAQPLDQMISQHPEASAILAMIYAILAHLLQSPVSPAPVTPVVRPPEK